MLMVEDSFSRYCCSYPIPNKEAHTAAKVLMNKYVSVYRLYMLRTQRPGIQYSWDTWLNPMFAYNTTVNSSTDVTLHYTMHFG